VLLRSLQRPTHSSVTPTVSLKQTVKRLFIFQTFFRQLKRANGRATKESWIIQIRIIRIIYNTKWKTSEAVSQYWLSYIIMIYEFNVSTSHGSILYAPVYGLEAQVKRKRGKFRRKHFCLKSRKSEGERKEGRKEIILWFLYILLSQKLVKLPSKT